MERSAIRVTLLGLLLALVTTLPNKDDWDIYSFHINATVTSRYATTIITSRVANRMDQSKEIEFNVRIPKNAFISKFRMFIDGEVYDGVVKGKEQAERQYTEAVTRGQSAGIVSSVGRTLEEFKTSVTVAAHKKVTFELTYEELLKRKLGKYELQIHAQPMQLVKDFKVDVSINEDVGINFVQIKGGLSTKDLANAITKTMADKQALINFYPTLEQQKDCDSCGEKGLNGDLVIFYDVKRDVLSGDVMTADGYFVHHFAPSNLPRIPKNVVFVIDQSGSMHGKKIDQTRIALIYILNDLAEEDFFGLITFDSVIFHWKRELVQATSKNKADAKTFAQNIQDRGSTDINEAVLEGARMLNVHSREGSASILILLTDGDPTSGVTNPERIQSNVRRAIASKFPLYCLGFGFDVNFEFLEKMSLENGGLARRIYEDSDADLQLQGFYDEVATPLLTDVTMIYIGGSNLTQTNFSRYYMGSEIVVAGQITDNDIENFIPEVVGISGNRKILFSNKDAISGSNGTASDYRIQRVWAYLTVKQRIEKELQLSGPEKEKVKKEAMELSLKYNFVTPLTSMVVTKPPGENTDVLNKPKEGDAPLLISQRQSTGGHRSFTSNAYRPGFPPASVQPGLHGLSGQVYLLRPMGHPGSRRRYHSRIGSSGRRGFLSKSVHSSSDYDNSYVQTIKSLDALLPVQATMIHSVRPTTAAPSFQRFLLRPENVSLPLCFDFPTNIHVKLFYHPNREFFVNGEFSLESNRGFTRIFIRFQSDLRIEVDGTGVTVKVGQTSTLYTGQDPITTGSVTVIRRDNETDVSVEDIHLVILVHEISGRKFLWPVLKHLPSDNSAGGILVLNTTGWEEVKQTSITKLKLKDQEIDISRSHAVDYSVPVPPTVDCWLLSAESALQKPQNDFYHNI